MSIDEIIDRQRQWLEELQKIIPNRPLLVKVYEGKIPQELYNTPVVDLFLWSDFKMVWNRVKNPIFTDLFCMLKRPIYTRAILPNEVVFDPDSDDWKIMKTEMDKLVSALRRLNIHFLLAHSGGKGCHVHVIFDMKGLGIEAPLFDKAKKAGFDLFRAVRQYVFNFLVNQSQLDSKKAMIDLPKINWDIHKEGSMVRDFGTMRAGGFCKTLITEIPAERPKEPLSVVFPNSIPLWNIPEIHNPLINKYIQSELQAKENLLNAPPIDLAKIKTLGKLEDVPCISSIMKGSASSRYYGAVAISLAAKTFGMSWEEAQPLVQLFLSRCTGLSSSDAVLRENNARSAYNNGYHFSCQWIKRNLPERCTHPQGCIIARTIHEAREQQSDRAPFDVFLDELLPTIQMVRAPADEVFDEIISEPVERSAFDIAFDKKFAITHHKSSIQKPKRKKKFKPCLGLEHALRGFITAPHQEAVATGIIIALQSWGRFSKEETELKLIDWSMTCIPPYADIKTLIQSINNESQKYKSPCSYFIKAGFCENSGCKVMNKKRRTKHG